jgi:DeoR family transcriptional regulator, fructose operon transcriptional repressor
MITNERQIKIVDIIKEEGNVSVDELAIRLNVSKMTIRRDLEKLQDNNLLMRTHGGAMANRVLLNEAAYATKREKNLEIKRKLAKEAIKHIQPNSTIYLDAGTTTYEVAVNMAGLTDLTIITNDIRIAYQLFGTQNKVIFLGGLILRETGSTTDQYTVDMLEDFSIDLAIMAVSSIDNHLIMCTPELNRQQLKKKVLKVAEKSILVTDQSKFFQKSLYKIGSIQLLDTIITDLELEELDGFELGSTKVVTL